MCEKRFELRGSSCGLFTAITQPGITIYNDGIGRLPHLAVLKLYSDGHSSPEPAGIFADR